MREEIDSVPEPGPRAPAVRLFAPGTEVGRRYEIRSVLGTGGSASVYAAWDRDLKRLVALKALRLDRMTGSTLKRFRREVAVARDAASPRLVRVFDIGEAGETVFLTMELVEGGSLRERLAAGPLPTRDAVAIGKEILRALSDLHRLGIVHRDVKPGNVLLAADGGVKLADFGLARHWEGGDTRATETEGIVGTMEYLAPEQALGRPVDARTDVYAFGIVLYELLSGNVPFISDSALGGVVARLRETAPDVRKVRPDVPAWLAGVIARTLEKEPGRRYQAAAEVLADLEAERSPGGGWARGRSSRRIVAVAAAGLALALGLLAAWLVPRGLPWARRPVPSLLTDGESGLKAVDASGKVLWTRPDVHGAEAAAVVRGEKGKVLVAVAVGWGVATPASATRETRRLALLDPGSGEVRSSHQLASGARFFPGFSDTYDLAQLTAVDIDGSGRDEVVAVFTHHPFYPGYAVLFEPGSGSSRVLLASSGHARLRGSFDLDGDGRREIVFEGPNNRMGWMSGTAVVRVPLPGPSRERRVDGPAPSPVATPDSVTAEANPLNLLWYALGPTALHRVGDLASFDPVSRLLTLGWGTASRVLTADGFAPGGGSPLSPPERQAARNRCYALLRDAVQREETGFAVDGLPLARQAVAEAGAAGDDFLSEWARRVSGRIAILAGRGAEGEKDLETLLDTSEAAPEIAYDMAYAFHLFGDTGRSARWYSWGLSRSRVGRAGRTPNEFLEGQLFALVEAERWTEAEDAISQYDSAFPGLPFPQAYRTFLAWRRGGRPPLIPEEATKGADDIRRYWALEARLAAGEELEPLARDLASERTTASTTAPLLLSLSAEIEARHGNLGAALTQATTAWNEVRAARVRQPWARAHLPVVADRLARIAAKAGRPDLAREALVRDTSSSPRSVSRSGPSTRTPPL